MQGEALASLCFVARVSIVTRCRSADFGTRVFFDNSGKQVAREAAAREVNAVAFDFSGNTSNKKIPVLLS